MPEIILGPPGCGKTTSLLDIVDAELARGVAPERIAYLSFTRRAAEEAVTRASEKFGLARAQLPWFRTLHSLCFRLLGLRPGEVMDRKATREFADWAGIRVTGGWSEDGLQAGFEPGDRIIFMENLARIKMVKLREQFDQFDDGLPWHEVERVARALREFKRARGLMDYTDMLQQFLREGLQLRLETLIGDECQDLPKLQWDVFDRLRQGAKRCVVAGDDDQAIFQWAGADSSHLVDMAGDVRVLGQSYRVPRAVQILANTLISPVAHRRPKQWAPRAAEGAVAHEVAFDVGLTEGPDVLVLARNAYVLNDVVAPALREAGVYYHRNEKPSVSTEVLQVISDWERLRAGGAVAVEAARAVYQAMSVGRGVARGYKSLSAFDEQAPPVTLDDLKKKGGLLVDAIWHVALDRLPQQDVGYILAMRRRGERLRAKPRVRISTIHGSKGSEAEYVIVLSDMAKRTHQEMETNPDPERRVWYVAVTRARERLTLVAAGGQLACPWV
jgi:DNA helicase-2/ATP-dependent DNA helicase PcrA